MCHMKKLCYYTEKYFSPHPILVLVVKNLPAKAGDIRDVGLIPGWGRSPREGNGNPLQFFCLENSMDRGAGEGCSPQGHKDSDKTETTEH